ncbi:MAG: phage tail protein [Flavobacteriales bacterium]|nr:phage tail protein [Flavobacteriales bacterium]
MEGTIGEIRMFGGNFAPRTWALCDGQLLPISQNTALFSILGTTYGGDGRTTFALPDMRGRVAVHAGSGPGLSTYRLGQKGGIEQTTLNVLNMPSHNHTAVPNLTTTVQVNNSDGEDTRPNGNFLGQPTSGDLYIDSAGSNQKLGGVATSGTVDIGNNGGSQPFSNVQPFCTVNYIICLMGIFPSRN